MGAQVLDSFYGAVLGGAGALGARDRWELPQALCPSLVRQHPGLQPLSALSLPAHAHGPGTPPAPDTLCGVSARGSLLF